MRLRKLVCPYDPSLINSLHRRQIAVRVEEPSLVREAADAVAKSNNSLLCVILDFAQPLTALPIGDNWDGIPVLLMVSAVGEFRGVVSKLPALKKPNLRVALPSCKDNLRDARILASVGVYCSIFIERGGMDGSVDWDELSDLMTYALCARVPHAPVDPFDYISRHYDPMTHLKWDAVYLENPEEYFHLDTEKNVALSSKDAFARHFIGRLDEVEKEEPPEVIRRADAWSNLFLEKSVCATCEGFKLCMGKYLPKDGKADGCASFFAEMFEVLGELETLKEKSGKEALWQL